jgi:beta-1,4-mannosyltransferase
MVSIFGAKVRWRSVGTRSHLINVLARPGHAAAIFNPFTSLLVDAIEDTNRASVTEFSPKRLLQGRWDIVHVHWPELAIDAGPLWRNAPLAGAYLASLRIAKARGARIVWTGHDLGLHENRWGSATDAYLNGFMRLVDGVIHLTDVSRAPLVKRYPMLQDKPFVTIVHGHYRSFYPTPPTRAAAQQHWNMVSDGPKVALIGQLRPYKGADKLIEAFRRFDNPEARLLIAGDPRDAALADDLVRRAKGDDRITLMLRRLSDAEVTSAITAADALVVPFQRILHSGSVVLAWSLNRPVIATNSATLAEQASYLDPMWTRWINDELTSDSLAIALSDLPSPDALCDVSALDWGPIGEQTVDFYRRLLSDTRRTDTLFAH